MLSENLALAYRIAPAFKNPQNVVCDNDAPTLTLLIEHLHLAAQQFHQDLPRPLIEMDMVMDVVPSYAITYFRRSAFIQHN